MPTRATRKPVPPPDHPARIEQIPRPQNIAAIRFEPFEETGITKKPVFHDFGITGAKFTRRQRFKGGDIDHHRARLMEAADQVFAGSRIDPGLAANRTVHLRQQGGGHLDEIHTAKEACGRKADKVADDTAAKSDEYHIAVDPQCQYVFEKPRQHGHALAGFAGRNGEAVAAPCRRPAGHLQRCQVMRRNSSVTDDYNMPAGKHAVRDVHDAV